jgi:hypothetical protein
MLSRKAAEQNRQRRQEQREANIAALCRPVVTLHNPVYAPVDAAVSAPKTAPKRNRALLDMAEGRPCLLCPTPHGCWCTPGSTVACHSNLAIHGKAKGRKADDHWSVWGGDVAHCWLDQGKASREVKQAAFLAAHARQVEAWKRVAADASEPARFRKAAQWALDQLEGRA